jgi:hypothetical protein
MWKLTRRLSRIVIAILSILADSASFKQVIHPALRSRWTLTATPPVIPQCIPPFVLLRFARTIISGTSAIANLPRAGVGILGQTQDTSSTPPLADLSFSHPILTQALTEPAAPIRIGGSNFEDGQMVIRWLTGEHEKL